MDAEATPVVDRGGYPDAATPWEHQNWRRDALGWAQRGLAAHGLRETRRRTVRLRPWSVLVRLPVEGPPGAVWFKANPPASAFEGPLTAALARRVPDHVLAPLAVDAERGWSLLPDGGPLFRDVLDRAADDPRAWEGPLRAYAATQRELVPHVQELARLGVPEARTTALPELFDRLVAENTALGPGDRGRLRALRSRLAERCAGLAAVGVPDSLDHADLHAGQLFAPSPGRFTFFDWGDATVSHPFCSLRVPVRAACERYGPQVASRLRDAYLEPWTGHGAGAAELRRAVSLAWGPAALGRAASFGRLFPGASSEADAACTEGAADALRQLADPPPF